MLLLWHIGVVFIFLALSRALGARRGFWIAAVFLLTPAWATAAMKAWGGYTTAFTASAVLMWLLVRDDRGMTGARWLLAGVLTAVTYLARPLAEPAGWVRLQPAGRRRPAREVEKMLVVQALERAGGNQTRARVRIPCGRVDGRQDMGADLTAGSLPAGRETRRPQSSVRRR